MDLIRHIRRICSNQQRAMAAAIGPSNPPCCSVGLVDYSFPRGMICFCSLFQYFSTQRLTRFSLPVGSSTTTAPRKVLRLWPSCTLMEMKMMLGCRLNLPRFKRASPSSTRMRPSPTLSCSLTDLLSVDCSSAVPFRHLSR